MAIDAFIDHLRDRTGGSLRVVSWYTADDFGALYSRSDLDQEAVKERVRVLSERLIHGERETGSNPLGALGREQAMVQVREEVVILRFPLENDGGLVAILDVDVASDLHSFVVDCTTMLEGAALDFRSPAAA